MEPTMQILNRNQIEDDRWDQSILSSACPQVYAATYYLDSATRRKWKGLVFDDYKAVMPIFEKNFIFYKKIVQPIISQQHGLYLSTEHFKMRETYLKLALDYIVKNYKNAHIMLNECNWIVFPKEVQILPRTNFVLELDRSYEKIFATYSKTLRNNIRKNMGMHIEEGFWNVHQLVDFYKTNMKKKVKWPTRKEDNIKNLFHTLLHKGLAKIYTVKDAEEKVMAAGFFVEFGNRIVYIFGSSNLEGMNANAMSILIDHIIQTHAGRKMYFDFEGSDLPGVKEFFKSFGPEERKYPQVSWENTQSHFALTKKIQRQLER